LTLVRMNFSFRTITDSAGPTTSTGQSPSEVDIPSDNEENLRLLLYLLPCL
jgi:hypothetical protein